MTKLMTNFLVWLRQLMNVEKLMVVNNVGFRAFR